MRIVAKTRVRTANSLTVEFVIKMGIHQGSALGTYIFLCNKPECFMRRD